MSRFVLVAACALLLGACASGSRIAREQPSPLPEFAIERQVRTLWSADAGKSVGEHVLRLTPAYAEEKLFTADRAGLVSAFRASDGEVVWRTDLDAPITTPVGVGEGLAVVASKKGEVFALGAKDGKRLWASAVSSEVLAAPAVAAGVVVVQSIDGKLFGLQASDGKRLWVYSRSEPALSLRGTSRPVVGGEYVFAGFASGRVAGLRVSDGRLVWEHVVTEPRGRNEVERLVDVDAPVLLAGDTLYAAAYQGKVVAVDLRSGRISWSRDVSTYVGMSADSRNLYIADESGRVTAFDRASGASVWKQDALRGRRLGAPARVGSYVAVGDYEGYLHWLSVDDGHFVSRERAGSGPLLAGAAASEDVLYVLTHGGELTALQVASTAR